MTVQIETSDDKVFVESPYDGNFISEAKTIGGRWDGNAWVFDVRDEDRVRDLCLNIYGENGRAANGEVVDVRLDVKEAEWELLHDGDQEIRFAGRRFARRPSRDEQVVLSEGVIVAEGSFESSAGSRKNPKIGRVNGVVLEIRDLPVSVADRIEQELGSAVTIMGDVDVKQQATKDALSTAIQDALEAGIDKDEIMSLLDNA